MQRTDMHDAVRGRTHEDARSTAPDELARHQPQRVCSKKLGVVEQMFGLNLLEYNLVDEVAGAVRCSLYSLSGHVDRSDLSIIYWLNPARIAVFFSQRRSPSTCIWVLRGLLESFKAFSMISICARTRTGGNADPIPTTA